MNERPDPPVYDSALTVDQALSFIASSVTPVEACESVAIRDALDRVLAADLLSPIDVPAHDNSAMDGYALRGSDFAGTTTFEVIGCAMAGRPFEATVAAGQCVRIMTGAMMPAGTDSVVPQEFVEPTGERITFPAGQSIGQHRRRRGEDLSIGTPALLAGRRMTPADIGLVASLGVAEVPVRRRLRVAFFSTGDELRSIGESLHPGQIYDSNRYTIDSMLRRLGVDRIDMGVVPDRPESLDDAVRIASGSADAIISTGGVSVGEADYTRAIMARLGDVQFWKIAMRPGRPMAFGRIGNACYFGLPGNPVSAMVTFYFLTRPALRRMMGATDVPDPVVKACCTENIRKLAGRTEYQRGILTLDDAGRARVALTGQQGSGMLRSMSQANCMIVLHHDQESLAAGDLVDCIPFEGLT